MQPPGDGGHGAFDFNPRSPCGERRTDGFRDTGGGGISIHAPRVGSDGTGGADGGGVRHFNPRSPCGERLARSQTKGIFSKFQSTLPVWGATGFSIVGVGFIPISIHAPRVGSDQGDHLPVLAHCHFNPRSPCGERRQSGLVHKEWCGYFNPRSPCGERPIMWRRRRSWGVFQSTLPVWGATRFTCSSKFSILDFNPRSPCGERQQRCTVFGCDLWRKKRFLEIFPVNQAVWRAVDGELRPVREEKCCANLAGFSGG